MLKIGMLAASLYVVHFFLLGALTGSAMNFAGLLRSYVYYKVTPSRHNSWILILFLIIVAGLGLLTWRGPISLLPMTGTLFGGLAYWQTNTKHIRRLALIASPLWFAYNFLSGSYPGMINEVIISTSNLIGQYRFDFKKRQPALRTMAASGQQIRTFNLTKAYIKISS